MTGRGAALARCSRASKWFGPLAAVSEVDLEVYPGEIVGLLGANGAGKTTLIRMLLGLTGTTEGEVALFGEPPSRRTRSRLGYVPQGLGLYDDLSPDENLKFSEAIFGTDRGGTDRDHTGRGGTDRGGTGRGGTGRDHTDRGGTDRGGTGRGGTGRGGTGRGGTGRGGTDGDGLPRDVRRYARERVGSLPLGVQRRVAFAQALSHRPDLLMLDEPTSGVDPLGRARLWETIAGAADAGAGVLVTTHYMEEAQECGRLVIMADGKVVAEGTAAEIVGSRQVVVVEAQSWSAAFGALEQAGLQVALAGRGLRVPGADPADVRRALGDLPAAVRTAPATLEERFFELARPGAAG